MVTRAHDGLVSNPSRPRTRPPQGAPAGVGTHLLAAIMVLVSLLFLAWVRVGSLHLGYELGRLRSKQDALVQDGRALQLEIGTLRSPARLAEMARKLDMVPPHTVSVVAPTQGGAP